MRRSRRGLVVLAVLAATAAGATMAATGASLGAAASPKPTPRVAVVLEVGGCPEGDTLRLCEGIKRAMLATGVRARIVTPSFREDLADFLSLLARQPYDAVVLWGLYYHPAVAAVARRYPKMPFVVVDAPRSDVPNAPNNVQGVVLQTHEAAFLAGWLAAKLEARRPGRDVVGVVGGAPVPGVTTFIGGFRMGAKRAVPGATVLVYYSKDFADPTKCAALARKQIARGAGTIFNVAGGCGLGAMEAAEDAGIWAVGVDTDQSGLGSHVLTSVLKSFEVGFAEVFRQIKAGRLRPGRDTILTIRDGAAGLGKISPRVPRQLLAQVEQLRRRIVSGDLRVAPAR